MLDSRIVVICTANRPDLANACDSPIGLLLFDVIISISCNLKYNILFTIISFYM